MLHKSYMLNMVLNTHDSGFTFNNNVTTLISSNKKQINPLSYALQTTFGIQIYGSIALLINNRVALLPEQKNITKVLVTLFLSLNFLRYFLF